MLPREYACCFHGDRRQRRHGCPLPFRDVQCGRIQCRGGRERPLLGTHAEILTTTFNHSSLVCRGTFLHLADDVSDPATVAQGTACGPGKVGAPPSQGCNQPLQLRHKEDTQVCVCVCVSGLSGPEVHRGSGVRGGRLSQQVSPSRGEWPQLRPLLTRRLLIGRPWAVSRCATATGTATVSWAGPHPTAGTRAWGAAWTVGQPAPLQVGPRVCVCVCVWAKVFCVLLLSYLFVVWLRPLPQESDPLRAALLVIFLLVLPLLLLVVVLRLPRVRRQLPFIRASGWIHKSRQNRYRCRVCVCVCSSHI